LIVVYPGRNKVAYMLNAVIATFSVIGAITTLVGLYELYEKYKRWKLGRAELQRKVSLLKSSDYFIAQIIHLGGEFSTTRSLIVYSNESGGYYFNPPKDFVNIFFNRGGDSTVVTPTELSREQGYVIDSVAGPNRKFEKTGHHDICHLPQRTLKNEHFVKFIKKID